MLLKSLSPVLGIDMRQGLIVQILHNNHRNIISFLHTYTHIYIASYGRAFGDTWRRCVTNLSRRVTWLVRQIKRGGLVFWASYNIVILTYVAVAPRPQVQSL